MDEDGTDDLLPRDRSAWIVEAAGKLISAYSNEESRHLERGLLQLNVIDGSQPSPLAVQLEGRNSILDRVHTVWALPATNDVFSAHHLQAPAPFDASGMVLLRRAWVGVDPHTRAAATVLPADPDDVEGRPLVRATYPVVPALVAYAVPRDESQTCEVLLRFLCTVTEAQQARLLPSRLPGSFADGDEVGARSARGLVRRIPESELRHHPVEGSGPVPWLRYALTGASGLEESRFAGGEALVAAAIALETLSDAIGVLDDLAPDEQVLCWHAALDAAAEAEGFGSWEAMRRDQAGSRLLGSWIPADVAENCADPVLFASLMLAVTPRVETAADRLAGLASPAQLREVRERLPEQLAQWLTPSRSSWGR